ncbi:YdcF family protein [Solibacillus sp. FSL R5-0691]|uniref:YdcF family protein n=1 Tax=Solibacillus sp. FSL R5-0691 TaxID=2921653 RepID=UPI0030CDD1D3
MVFLIFIIIALFIIEPRWYNNIYISAIILLINLLYYTEKIFFNQDFSEQVVNITGYVFVFAFIPLVMATMSVLTYFNSKVLLEKEGRKKSNLFIGLIGVAVNIVLVYYIYSMYPNTGNKYSEAGFFYVLGLFVYFTMMYSATALYVVLYNWRPIAYKPDYIIILGSGLIGDQVPPLLASRIVKGVQQYKKYGGYPLIITSGGQGSDEKVAESYAMKQYIHKHYPDIPDEAVVMDDQSTTTYENMLCSKKIIMKRFGAKARGIFVSNNYHILRASYYAKRAKLRANGVGSKTAFYYVPNAFTREFIGLLEMFKWRHIALVVLFTIFSVLVFRTM